MKRFRDVLGDRRRSQQGSVLSGVLIITAFLAIIAGALMTELSTNFLLSRNLLTRVNNQATVESAVEQAVSQLSGTQLNQPCPGLSSVNLNGRTAVASYLGCFATVRRGEPRFTQIAGPSAQFTVDATIGPNGDYVVGDVGGNVFDYPFGSSSPRWRLALGGSVTAPPLVIPRPGLPGQFLDVIPMSGAACSPSSYCLNVRTDGGGYAPPSQSCSVSTSSPVVTPPAASPSVAGLVYYAAGTLLAANDVSVAGGGCDPEATITTSASVVTGPVALRCTSGCGSISDYVSIAVPDNNVSEMALYSYSAENLQAVWNRDLPWASPTGMASLAGGVPANMIVTFSGGTVALYNVTSSSIQLVAWRQLPAGIRGAPSWCGGPCGNRLAVGAQNGGLYLFDSSLNPAGSYTGTGSAIYTTPGADGAGNWYYGANDGYVHEVQMQSGQLVEVTKFGPIGQIGSSVRVGGCATGVCVYTGSLNSNLYLIGLDARDATLSACISTSPPSCSGANPRLWTSVEVGAAGNPSAVHVVGSSYYSP